MTPTKHFDPKRERAARLMLVQLHGVQSYSLGNKIIEGDEIADMRRQLLCDMINRRQPKEQFFAQARHTHHWGNLVNFDSLRSRAQARDGEKISTKAQRFREVISAEVGARNDENDRAQIARRALRKHFPEAFAALPLGLAHSKRELRHMAESAERKRWVTKCDIDAGNGLIIKAGEPVRRGLSGDLSFINPEISFVGVRPNEVRRARKRDQAAEPQGYGLDF